jgi:ComF family protein
MAGLDRRVHLSNRMDGRVVACKDNQCKIKPICKRHIGAATGRDTEKMSIAETVTELRAPIARAAAALRRAGRFTLDVALPPLCPSCRDPLGDGIGLCATCWSKLSLIEPPFCARLGIPFTYDPGPGLLSMDAIANPPAYDRARAAVRYDDVARALVHGFKYGDRLDLAPLMGHWMARAGRELLDGADALLPVPLHWRRLWARRFNQSAALAAAISELSGVPVLAATLKRVRATAQQVGLSKAERADNVQGAFRVRNEAKAEVARRRLVLVDDVLTSGATVDTCARALLRAGAAHVDVLVFARVVTAAGRTI